MANDGNRARTLPAPQTGREGTTTTNPAPDITPDLEKRMANLDDAKRLDLLLVEMAKEANAIEKSRHKSGSAQAASRRVTALAKMAAAIAQKHELLRQEGLDTNSPAVRILVQFVMERTKQVMADMGLDEETVQTFFTKFPPAMEGWEVEVERRIKRSLFQPPPAQVTEENGDAREA